MQRGSATYIRRCGTFASGPILQSTEQRSLAAVPSHGQVQSNTSAVGEERRRMSTMTKLNHVGIAGILIAACALWSGLAHAQSRLPGDDAIGAAAGEQVRPAVSRGGGILLTAWSDRRSYPPDASSFFEFETSADIYGMRIDAAGNAL